MELTARPKVFLLDNGLRNRLLPVEVKASRSERLLPSRSLRSFLKAYRPATALVVNLSLAHGIRVGETAV